MGILIGCEGISHEWPGKKILENQTIGIHEADRIGIVGKNGDGKSTLLSLIAHRFTPDAGEVTWRGGITLGYLGQTDALDDNATVEHEVVGDTPEYQWASDPKIRNIIDELLQDIDWHALIGTLSGGQRRRVDLARLLVGDWDVILMDEPTNHLDVEAITWLADHLKRRWPANQGALLVVTHDRWFLDEVATSMWEVHDRIIDPFEGGYSAYIQQRAERARLAAVHEERRQSILRKELAWLARGPKARSSKPKFRIEEAKALIADEPPLRNELELRRMAVSRLGKKVIDLKDVSLAYGDKQILNNVEWLIGPGDRIGILGENGAGKSSLLNLMQEKIEPTEGYVKVGKSVKFGVLSQRLDFLEEKSDWRVNEVLSQFKTTYTIGDKEYTPKQLLEQLGFDREEYESFVQDLSGGQLRRLGILCVLMREPNVLILDEPGNDLDTDMLAELENLLDSWPGTLILVSHDRYLMERVTDNQYALVDGDICHVPGGVDEYLDMIHMRSAYKNTKTKVIAETEESQDSGQANGLSNQEWFEMKKRFDAVGRKLKKISDNPQLIRDKMSACDPTDFEQLTKLQEELNATQAEIDEYEEEWLELAEVLDLG